MAALCDLTAALELELLEFARYNELSELVACLEKNPKLNINTPSTSLPSSFHNGNTPLHYACANGHVNVVNEIVQVSSARHACNNEGNTPLHWCACNANRDAPPPSQGGDAMTDYNDNANDDTSPPPSNKHVDCARLLISNPNFQIDVCLQNKAGRSSLTEAFQSDNKEMIKLLLEHPSASEDRLLVGIQKESLSKEDKESVSVTHDFTFLSNTPSIKVRELPIENPDDPFTNEVADDTTGLGIWAASLVLASYLAHACLGEDGSLNLPPSASSTTPKIVLELGAGCAVPGLAAAKFLKGDNNKVYLTDLNKDAVDNITFNVSLNEMGGSQSEEKLLKSESAAPTKNIQSLIIDWAKLDSFNKQSVDVLVGSDLIYSTAIVPLLKKVIQHLLSEDGVFIYCAPTFDCGQRDGLEEFIGAMKSGTKGFFKCTRETLVDKGSKYKANPLTTKSEDDCFIHFNELYEKNFVVYEFRRV